MNRSGVDDVDHDSTNSTSVEQRMTIEVSDDHQQAWVRPVNPDDPQPFTSEETIAALEEAKIVVDETVQKLVNEFVPIANFSDDRPERYLVAEGRSAIEGTNGTFQKDESCLRREQDWQGDAAINYYNYNSIHMVETDDPIGTLTSAVPGVEGVDVYGQTLKLLRQPVDVQLDDTVRRSDDDASVVLANVAGQIVFSERVLSIKEVFAVANDVDFGTGNIDSPVDIQIRGTVRDGFIVKSHRAITIGGAVESATIEAGGVILVRGGILQKGHSSLKCGGDVVARFCDEANLHVAGDLKICKELMNSHVHCEGTLYAAHGAIIGGSVYAREGIEVAVLGSDANVTTNLAVGMHPSVIDESEQIRKELKPKKEAAERIRRNIQPLMADLKRLSPEQKEKVTELMYEADAMDAEVVDVENKRTTMLLESRAHGIPYVLVTRMVHEGVTIRIGRRATSFRKEMPGPVKIEKRKLENVTEFVAVNQLTGSIQVVPSHYVVEQPQEDEVELTDSESRGRDGSCC